MNREAERKRLVELIENFFEEEIGASFVKGFLDKFAENILDDGWMRPPVKVGDVVYTNIIGTGMQNSFIVNSVDLLGFSNGTYSWTWHQLGKSVYTSREEAQKALEGSGEK